MQAVMYGGGNIGRGFIGGLFSKAGYEVTFIDVAEPVVNALRERRQYPIRYVSSAGHVDEIVAPVTAVNGNDTEAAAEAIASCDIMATAVGARILKFIVGNIVEGLRKRWARTDAPLNIIICENLMDANLILEKMLKELLTEDECKKFDETVGLVEASIGRMVPVQTEEMKDGDPLRVCVERYGFLPTDGAAFKGEIPNIPGMVPFAPFDFYIKRKLYLHNMGHATCAYLGDLMGLSLICDAIDQPEIRILTEGAMDESLMALSKRYSVPMEQLMLHKMDLLHRFTNRALGDTCARVGGDPGRKLSPADRLVGAAKLAVEMGVVPAYMAVGAAAGVWRYVKEAGWEQSAESCRRVLTEVSQLPEDHTFAQLVEQFYGMILAGQDVAALRRAADEARGSALKDIV